MNSEDIFDSEYADNSTDSTYGKPSTTKAFLKDPIDDEEIKQYGRSKPYRITISAKIIKDSYD